MKKGSGFYKGIVMARAPNGLPDKNKKPRTYKSLASSIVYAITYSATTTNFALVFTSL